MEEELEQAEKNFKIIADSAPFALWISGLDKKCFYFNKCWLDFTGKTLEMEIGNQWANGVHPDDLDNCLDVYVSYFNARKPFKMEYRLKRYDGLYRWVLDTGNPRYSPSGEFMGFVGSCIDVTDMWFAHHEMVSYSKQQDELISCSNKLMDFLNNIKNYNNQRHQQQQQQQSIIDNNYSAVVDNKINFIELILKSCSISLNSNVSVLFKINPSNRLEMFVDTVVNNNGDDDLNEVIPKAGVSNMPRFQLPLDFWESFNDNNEGNSSGGGSLPYFSILFQKYFTPYLNEYGIKSITATDVCSFNERIYGFIVIGSTIEREYSSIEQNTLICLANILGVYLNKTEEIKINSIKEKISSFISRNCDNPILTVDKIGTIVDMNPAAVKTLISPSSNKASTSQLPQLKMISIFPFLKGDGSSSTTTRTTQSFYTALQNNYFLNENRFSKSDQDKFFETNIRPHYNDSTLIPVEVLIKEIHFDQSIDQTIYLFILKDLSLQKENEKMKKQLQQQQEKQQSEQAINCKDLSNCIDNIYYLVQKDTSNFTKEQLDLLNNLFKLNNNNGIQKEGILSLNNIIKGLFSNRTFDQQRTIKLNLNLNDDLYVNLKIDKEVLTNRLNNILDYCINSIDKSGTINISDYDHNGNIRIKIRIIDDINGGIIHLKNETDDDQQKEKQTQLLHLLKDHDPTFQNNNSILILNI